MGIKFGFLKQWRKFFPEPGELHKTSESNTPNTSKSGGKSATPAGRTEGTQYSNNPVSSRQNEHNASMEYTDISHSRVDNSQMLSRSGTGYTDSTTNTQTDTLYRDSTEYQDWVKKGVRKRAYSQEPPVSVAEVKPKNGESRKRRKRNGDRHQRYDYERDNKNEKDMRSHGSIKGFYEHIHTKKVYEIRDR
eukprot:UN25468